MANKSDEMYFQLRRAIESTNIETLTNLLSEVSSNNYDINHMPERTSFEDHLLIISVEIGDLKITKSLIDSGIEIRYGKISPIVLAMDRAIHKGNLEMVKLLYQSNPRCADADSLWRASNLYHFEIVDFLIEKGATISYGNVASDLIKDRNNMEKSYRMFVKLYPVMGEHYSLKEIIDNDRLDIFKIVSK